MKTTFSSADDLFAQCQTAITAHIEKGGKVISGGWGMSLWDGSILRLMDNCGCPLTILAVSKMSEEDAKMFVNSLGVSVKLLSSVPVLTGSGVLSWSHPPHSPPAAQFCSLLTVDQTLDIHYALRDSFTSGFDGADLFRHEGWRMVHVCRPPMHSLYYSAGQRLFQWLMGVYPASFTRS